MNEKNLLCDKGLYCHQFCHLKKKRETEREMAFKRSFGFNRFECAAVTCWCCWHDVGNLKNVTHSHGLSHVQLAFLHC